MTGFIFLRVRAHRLLLAAALLVVFLTTAVLATLTAFSGSIGDVALRHSLRTSSAAQASLVARAQVPPGTRKSADRAVRDAARRTFDGLPVGLRSLARSGSYALPGAQRGAEPDLTHFAALDRSRVLLTKGSWPSPYAKSHDRGDDQSPVEVEVALPEAAATRLKLGPGSAPLTLTDRLTGPRITVRVTGVYRPADPTEPYWQLDDLGGRGVRESVFLTYGPLLADPTALGHVSADRTQWLATADFRTMTTDRVDALREAAKSGPAAVVKSPRVTAADR